MQQILQIAEELVLNKKTLSAELLFKLVKRQLKIPRKEILSVIQWLFEKKILVEGSKLTKELVLSNQNRKVIFNFIKSNLGANFSLLKERAFQKNELGVKSPAQLIWHLQMLIRFNYIKRVPFKNFSLFIPIEIEDNIGILAFLLRDGINRKIVKLLMDKVSIKRADIYKYIEETRELVYYKISILIETGILSFTDDTNQDISLNPTKKAAILELSKYLADLNE